MEEKNVLMQYLIFGYERVFLRLHTVNNRKNNIKKGGVDLKMLFK